MNMNPGACGVPTGQLAKIQDLEGQSALFPHASDLKRASKDLLTWFEKNHKSFNPHHMANMGRKPFPEEDFTLGFRKPPKVSLRPSKTPSSEYFKAFRESTWRFFPNTKYSSRRFKEHQPQNCLLLQNAPSRAEGPMQSQRTAWQCPEVGGRPG